MTLEEHLLIERLRIWREAYSSILNSGYINERTLSHRVDSAKAAAKQALSDFDEVAKKLRDELKNPRGPWS